MGAHINILKAAVLGRDGSEKSNVNASQAVIENLFHEHAAEKPPYDPATLFAVFEASGGLRSNVDAMATNIDGLGHMFAKTIDLDSEEAEVLIAEALSDRKEWLGLKGRQSEDVAKVLAHLKKEDGMDGILDNVPAPAKTNQAEVTKTIEEVSREMVRERMRLECFFDHLNPTLSFVQIRMQTRLDLEVCGNAYWEVLRNKAGAPVQINKIPAADMRLRKQNVHFTPVRMPVRRNIITFHEEVVQRRFRLYLQAVTATQVVFFKDLGDPQLYSSKTGKPYKNLEALQLAEKEESDDPSKPTPDIPAATEIIHFKVHSPTSSYGVPRWIGELVSVLGVRNAEEINLMYFDNKGIPPMVVKVTGGRLNKASRSKLENFIQTEIKGKKNFHKIMILEAEPGGAPMAGLATSQMRIELEPLTKFQQDDGQFMKYIETSTDRLGQTFRMPRILRGDSRDMGRSANQTALKFAEGQVFKPARTDFDFTINRRLLPLLEVQYHRFTSNGPDFTEPAELVLMLNKMSQAGILIPEELRQLAAKAFSRQFKRIRQEWTQRPVILTQEGIRVGSADVEGTAQEPPQTGGETGSPTDEPAETKQPKVEKADDPELGEELKRLMSIEREMVESGFWEEGDVDKTDV